MKTLLFAPLFIDGPERFERNIQWVQYLNEIEQYLKFDEIYMVDNKSDPILLNEFNYIFSNLNLCTVTIEECKTHLPRKSHLLYPYWYNAFAKACKYALDNGFEKIVHIDTDFYLLNEKICDYINYIDYGWSTFWCGRHNFPEATFQIIGNDKLEEAYEFYTRDFLAFYGEKPAETEIPFTKIIRCFKGDRYGEDNLEQTSDMDFYAQKPNNILVKFNERG